MGLVDELKTGDEFRALMKLQPGETFSGQRLSVSQKAIGELLLQSVLLSRNAGRGVDQDSNA